MTNLENFQIKDDKELEKYGIYTTKSLQAPERTLGRQAFRDAQVKVFDEYPKDEPFVLAVIAAIELGSDIDMRGGWGETPQPVKYVQSRRPSQPDFLIDAEVANKVLHASRYRRNRLAVDPYRYGMNKYNLYTLQEALMHTGLKDIITTAELESPLRLSGGVHISPPWEKETIAANPRMLTLNDFERHVGKNGFFGDIAHAAFLQVGSYLLGQTGGSDDTHAFASDFFRASTYADSAVGIVSLDTAQAYSVVFEKWKKKLEESGSLPYRNNLPVSRRDSHDRSWWEAEAPKVVSLAQLAIAGKVPNSWYAGQGRVTPPPSEEDFEF